MKALFAHDHRFISVCNSIYSRGGLPAKALERYLGMFDSLTVVGRVKQEDGIPKGYVLSSSEGIEFIGVTNARSLSGLLRIRNIYRAIAIQVIDSDWVICRLPSTIGLLAWFAARRNNVPAIVEVVGNSLEANMLHGSVFGKLLGPIEHFLTKLAVKNSERCVYITKKYLQSVYPTLGLSEVCSNADIEMPTKDVLSKRLNRINKPSHVYVLGMVGSLDVRYKGQETVLKVLRELIHGSIDSEYYVQFVGAGDKTHYLKIAKALQISENVEFMGSVDRGGAMFDWLDSIDFLVHPSKVEAQGRIIVEGMSRACPVIASNVGGIPELLPSNCTFNPEDHLSMAESIQSMVKDRSLQKKVATDNWTKAKEYSNTMLNGERNRIFNKFIGSKP